MGQLSLPHLLVLVLILLIFFGPSRLPQLGQSIGKAIKGFKEGLNEIDGDSKNVNSQAHLNPGSQDVVRQVTTENATDNIADKKENKS